MKNLVIDIGNSSIKFAEAVNGKLGKAKFENYDKNNFEEKIKILLSKKNLDVIGVSCANKNHALYIEKKFGRQKNIRIIKRNSKLPIKIDYAKTLGTDRICGALGAVKKFPERKNILTIDFGTATTYNLISGKIFIGGLITPGIQTSLSSLIQNTSLPKPKLIFKKKFFYKNTPDNISNGVILQSLFFTEKIITEYKKDFKNLFIIATGGNAKIVFPLVKLINKIEPDLNLEGLNFFLQYSRKL